MNVPNIYILETLSYEKFINGLIKEKEIQSKIVDFSK